MITEDERNPITKLATTTLNFTPPPPPRSTVVVCARDFFVKTKKQKSQYSIEYWKTHKKKGHQKDSIDEKYCGIFIILLNSTGIIADKNYSEVRNRKLLFCTAMRIVVRTIMHSTVRRTQYYL